MIGAVSVASAIVFLVLSIILRAVCPSNLPLVGGVSKNPLLQKWIEVQPPIQVQPLLLY